MEKVSGFREVSQCIQVEGNRSAAACWEVPACVCGGTPQPLSLERKRVPPMPPLLWKVTWTRKQASGARLERERTSPGAEFSFLLLFTSLSPKVVKGSTHTHIFALE